jgi:DNA (cytosine-5)-methyltransferase 1
LFKYEWYLKDGYPAAGIEKNGLNVFGTFICGGGSSMGYKLAGYNHLGGVEIDKKVASIYKLNHNPKYLYEEDLREFNKREDLPDELYNLDILDGSPPCSTFSMAGSREKAWGKSKKFREGQANQTLDDLVFVYCDTILKLEPKVFILENVKGIIQGNAKVYSKQIVDKLSNEYNVQVFCLNAATMGVPQKRERVFFIGSKLGLGFGGLNLKFFEKSIKFGDIYDKSETKKDMTDVQYSLWLKKNPDDKTLADIRGTVNGFNDNIIRSKDICPTITSSGKYLCADSPRWFNKTEYCKCGTYPIDYNFTDMKPQYLIGMSVPPVMTAQISNEINKQWFKQK